MSKTYLFRDRFSGADMFSVAQPYKLMPDNDAVFVVQSQVIKKNASGEVDIGCGRQFGGKNEEDDEPVALAEGEVLVNNIVETYGLQEITFTKKDFTLWLKPYLGKIKSALEASRPERLPAFMSGAQKFAQQIATTFDDWCFFVNSANDYEAMICFAKYEGESTVPQFYFIRDGLALCFPGTGSKLTGEALVPPEVAVREGYAA